MPFGEELYAGQCGRTTALGYVGDAIRQKFTGYERDNETGLDYAQVRYCSSSQGRFTSPDPLMASARPTNPQSWNRYSYVGNKPMTFSDPSGMSARPGGRNISNWNGAMASEQATEGISPWPDLSVEQPIVSGIALGSVASTNETPQSAGRILIIVGDRGLGRHDVGTNFERVADTKRQELEAEGYEVIVVRASSDQDFANALTSNGTLNGVEYVGHASYNALHIGQEEGAHTNLTDSDLSMLSNQNLSPDAYIKLNACYSGAAGGDSIAAGISSQLQRTTLAFDGGTVFSGNERTRVTERSRTGMETAPRRGPLYLIEDHGTVLRGFVP